MTRLSTTDISLHVTPLECTNAHFSLYLSLTLENIYARTEPFMHRERDKRN